MLVKQSENPVPVEVMASLPFHAWPIIVKHFPAHLAAYSHVPHRRQGTDFLLLPTCGRVRGTLTLFNTRSLGTPVRRHVQPDTRSTGTPPQSGSISNPVIFLLTFFFLKMTCFFGVWWCVFTTAISVDVIGHLVGSCLSPSTAWVLGREHGSQAWLLTPLSPEPCSCLEVLSQG